MIATKDSKYEPRPGLTTLTKRERLRLAEKRIHQLKQRKHPLEQELAHINNMLTYWEQVRLIELYHSTPVERVKSYEPRKARKDKGFRHKRVPTSDEVKEAFEQLSNEEKKKVIKRLSKTVAFQRFKIGGK